MSQRRRLSTFARRLCLVGACLFMLLAVVTNRLAVADSFTGQIPWAGHWLTSVVLGVASFALGFGYFGPRDNDTG
ncbi:hypothetical protein ACOQFL_03055 [Actinopolyspora sp. H202]|uniref:hypothetical protein n=1 Tax=Actinopolyspora sp. H202 TaxID=1500456 RepID=UPI003EE5856E